MFVLSTRMPTPSSRPRRDTITTCHNHVSCEACDRHPSCRHISPHQHIEAALVGAHCSTTRRILRRSCHPLLPTHQHIVAALRAQRQSQHSQQSPTPSSLSSTLRRRRRRRLLPLLQLLHPLLRYLRQRFCLLFGLPRGRRGCTFFSSACRRRRRRRRRDRPTPRRRRRRRHSPRGGRRRRRWHACRPRWGRRGRGNPPRHLHHTRHGRRRGRHAWHGRRRGRHARCWGCGGWRRLLPHGARLGVVAGLRGEDGARALGCVVGVLAGDGEEGGVGCRVVE